MPPETSLKINWIEARNIVPHTFNPRPWSSVYFARVHDEHVIELAESIQAHGFALNEAIVVRPIRLGRYLAQLEEHGFPVRLDLNGRSDDEIVYEVPIGNHRYAAARSLGCTEIPCFLEEEMSDEKSLLAVINRQGKEPEPWFKAQHAYECCHHGYGRNGSMTQQAYGELMGVGQPVIAQWISAYRVKLSISGALDECPIKVKVARQIASLNKSDWKWFAELMVQSDWSEVQRKCAIAAVKGLEIPEHFHGWLPPLLWKKEAAIEAAQFESSDLSALRAGLALQWIRVAQSCLDSGKLAEERQVWIFEGDRPRLITRNLRQEFLSRLKSAKADSETRVRGVMNQLLLECKDADDRYSQWQQSRLDTEAQIRVQEEQARTRLAMEMEYAPQGFRSWTDLNNTVEVDSFDAIAFEFPNSPETEFDSPWLVEATDLLKPGGVVLSVCKDEEIFEFRAHVVRSQLAWAERVLWLTGGEGFKDVCVAIKAGGDWLPEPDRDRIISNGYGLFGANILEWQSDLSLPPEIAQYLLLRYLPRGGSLLNLFPGQYAPLAIAAKNLGFKSVFLEPDSRAFDLASGRIESSKFEWER